VYAPVRPPEGDVHAARVQRLDSTNCGLHLTRGQWALVDQRKQRNALLVRGRMVFQNTTSRNEIFVTDVKATTRLLSKGDVAGIEVGFRLPPVSGVEGNRYSVGDKCLPRRGSVRVGVWIVRSWAVLNRCPL
jgi:hypothetical protein